MKPRILALVLAATAFAFPARADNQPAPYAGQQARSIKSLSAEDVAALLKGEGMGMAKAAELNGYPGPVHVLTLADELRLTEWIKGMRIGLDPHEELFGGGGVIEII